MHANGTTQKSLLLMNTWKRVRDILGGVAEAGQWAPGSLTIAMLMAVLNGILIYLTRADISLIARMNHVQAGAARCCSRWRPGGVARRTSAATCISRACTYI